MLRTTLAHNKKTYLAYNQFRKGIFRELTPKDADVILYLLPWMLSVNHPSVPGFISNLKKPIAVFGATTDRTLIHHEPSFKTRFDIRKSGPLLKPSMQSSLIQGLYTIGSAGTISQTAYSDCDIWICIKKEDFEDHAKTHLQQKVNLIKDWMDANLKMPVYFFICDLEDIRNANFGVAGVESSGSAQRNVLKEEFYRTCILISGKIPLWWVCFDSHAPVDYGMFCRQYAEDFFEDCDCIDMGAPEAIDDDEYFGAALWQFNKALTHPMKSVIKMLLLEMLLVSHREELLCHRFRSIILDQETDFDYQDPSIFTINAILDYNRNLPTDVFNFIKQCCYLRYDIKFYSKKQSFKANLAKAIFKPYPLARETIWRLNAFSRWPLGEQLALGEEVFTLLLSVYKRIMISRNHVISSLTRQDMTVIGRKLATCLEKKPGKIPVVHKPVFELNLPTLTFSISDKVWQVHHADRGSKPLVTSEDIICCIAYLIWNDIYDSSSIRMTPNPTPVTLQEINNLAKRIREIFGVFNVTGVDFEHFMEPERATRMLIIVNFDDPTGSREMNDIRILYCNHWGELFFNRFKSQGSFRAFINHGGSKFRQTRMFYHIQRNNLYYEKIIERAKNLVNQVFSGIAAS